MPVAQLPVPCQPQTDKIGWWRENDPWRWSRDGAGAGARMGEAVGAVEGRQLGGHRVAPGERLPRTGAGGPGVPVCSWVGPPSGLSGTQAIVLWCAFCGGCDSNHGVHEGLGAPPGYSIWCRALSALNWPVCLCICSLTRFSVRVCVYGQMIHQSAT